MIESPRATLKTQGARLWRRRCRRDNEQEEEDNGVECWLLEPQPTASQAAPQTDQHGETTAQKTEKDVSATMTEMSLHEQNDASSAASATPSTRFQPPTPLDPSTPLLPYYLLDAASVLAVDALEVGPFHSVLDLCAAPGGKSVCIAQRLRLTPNDDGSSTHASAALGSLHSNEPQQSRRQRLHAVLSEYIPQSIRRNRTRIDVSAWDATHVSLPASRYDRVLVDAPCSSDRHVLSSAAELGQWSTKRVKSNHERQVALLLNALKVTKPGGITVYATCSLSRLENDGVIDSVRERLQRQARRGTAKLGHSTIRVKVLPMRLGSIADANADSQPADLPSTSSVADSSTSTSPLSSATSSSSVFSISSDPSDVLPFIMGEPTKYGWMILPDQPQPHHHHSNTNPNSISNNAHTGTDTPNAADSAKQTGESTNNNHATATTSASKPRGHGFGPLYFCRLRRLPEKGEHAHTANGDDDEHDGEATDDEEQEFTSDSESDSDSDAR